MGLGGVVLGTILGMVLGAASYEAARGGQTSNSGLAHAAPSRRPSPPAGFSRFDKLESLARALTLLEREYVLPVDGEALIEAALQGMTARLDPHTSYLPADEAKMLLEDNTRFTPSPLHARMRAHGRVPMSNALRSAHSAVRETHRAAAETINMEAPLRIHRQGEDGGVEGSWLESAKRRATEKCAAEARAVRAFEGAVRTALHDFFAKAAARMAARAADGRVAA